jgi:hypothetical protein
MDTKIVYFCRRNLFFCLRCVLLYHPSKNIAFLSFNRTGFLRATDFRCYTYLSATVFYFDSTCRCNRLQAHLFTLALMHTRNYKMKQATLMENYEYESNFLKCCRVFFFSRTGLNTNMNFRINFLHNANHTHIYSCLWLKANRLQSATDW